MQGMDGGYENEGDGVEGDESQDVETSGAFLNPHTLNRPDLLGAAMPDPKALQRIWLLEKRVESLEADLEEIRGSNANSLRERVRNFSLFEEPLPSLSERFPGMSDSAYPNPTYPKRSEELDLSGDTFWENCFAGIEE